MLLAIFPLYLAVVGALLYLLATRAELKEMGRTRMRGGLLALAFSLAQHVVRIG